MSDLCVTRRCWTLHHIVGDFTTLELVMGGSETANRVDTGISPAPGRPNSAVRTRACVVLSVREAAYLEGRRDVDRAFRREVLV